MYGTTNIGNTGIAHFHLTGDPMPKGTFVSKGNNLIALLMAAPVGSIPGPDRLGCSAARSTVGMHWATMVDRPGYGTIARQPGH